MFYLKMAEKLLNRFQNVPDGSQLNQLRLEFEMEKCNLYEKLLLHRILQKLTTSDQLPEDVRVYLSDLLSCQEVKCLDQKLLACFTGGSGRLSPKDNRPSNFKSTLQKALTDELNNLKTNINCLLPTVYGFTKWSECASFYKTISNSETKMFHLQNNLFSLAEEYETVLKDYFKTVRCYADKILQSLQLKHFKETDEWLQEKAKALQLKAKVVELQFLTETYSAERIAKLKQLNASNVNKFNGLESEINYVRASLKAYEAVAGPIYDKMVQEYENLHKEIENKLWALNEFQKKEISDKRN